MIIRGPIAAGLVAGLFAAAIGGCGGRSAGPAMPEAQPDFVERKAAEPGKVYSAAAGDRGPKAVEVDREEAAGRRAYTVDAMIGQINGKPVYATAIFEEIGAETLARLGATQPRQQFRRRAQQLLAQKLQQMLFDALLLAEAEAELSEQQQQGLLGMLRKFREERTQELIYGDEPRSASAQQRTIEERVAEDVEERRQQLIIQKHLREKIHPQVDVSRREVERYYRKHRTEFNPPARIELRLILTGDPSTAEEVDKALAAGEPFGDVAEQYGSYRPERGGLMAPMEARLKRFDALSWPALNQAIQGLSVGEHTGRVKIDGRFAWAYLDSYQKPESRSLNEVWLEIEKKLRSQEFERAQRQYMSELMERGNFTPMEQMLDVLLRVAVNRYAQVE